MTRSQHFPPLDPKKDIKGTGSECFLSWLFKNLYSHHEDILLFFSHSVMSDSLQPHGLQHERFFLSFTISWSLLKFMSIKLVMLSNHLILCHPFLLLPSVFPSIMVFSSESTLHIRWPKYRNIGFSNSPCSEHSGLISFRIDWFDLLAVQGALKSLLQHDNLRSSILWHSAIMKIYYL